MESAGTEKLILPGSRGGKLSAVPPSFKIRQFWAILGIFFLFLPSPGLCGPENSSPPDAHERVRRAHTLLLEGQYDSSLALFEEAAAEFRRNAAWKSYLYCLNGIGENLIRTARYEEARTVLAEADSLAREVLIKGDPGLIRTLHLRGYIALYRDDFPAAVSMFQEAARLTRELTPGDTAGIAGCLQMIGTAQTRMGEYDSAESSYRLALELLEESDGGSDGLRRTIRLAMARNRAAQGRYASAREILLDLRRPEAGGTARGFDVEVLDLLSDVEYELGEFSEALRIGEEALTLSRQVFGERHPFTVNQIAGLGDLQAASGRYDEAVLYLRLAVELYGEVQGTGQWALGSLYRRLSRAYRQQGTLDSALVYARRGLLMAGSAIGEDHAGCALFEETLAETYVALGDTRAALLPARRALELYRSTTSTASTDLARSYTLLAAVKNGLDLQHGAIGLADTALELYRSMPAGPEAAKAWRVKGESLLGLASAAEAKRCFTEALTELGLEEPLRVGDGPDWMDLYGGREAVRSLLGYARAGEERFRGDPTAIWELKASYEASRLAAGILTDMRARYLTEQPKLHLAVYGEPAYAEALRLALRMHEVTGDAAYLDEAFTLAEAAKAGSLIDALLRADATQFSGVEAGLLETEKRLKRELFALDTRLHAGGSVPPASALVGRRFELQRELDRVLASYASVSGDFSNLARRPLPMTPAGAMELLDDRSALVEYCVLGDRLVMFVVTSDRFTCATTPLPLDLEQAVLDYCESLRTFDVEGYAAQARMLGSLLLDPIRGAITGKERLLLVPADYLWYLPFETLLLAPAESGRDFSAMPYLLTNCEVTYLYSASFLRELLRSEQLAAPVAFAGFAPEFEGVEGESYAEARQPAGAGEFRRRGLGELPQAAAEVEAIADAFSRQSHPGKAFVGREATEASFRRRAQDFGYVHVASHSFVDEAHPGLTGIIFSGSGESVDDGVLHAGEMFDLELRAALVVLSSCRSGLGKIIPGEGLLAMTRGMFWSGARNVMVSLWDVYDRHANELMVKFYPGLLGGQSVGSSLRKAKLAMIASPRTAFPGKWGGFVHLGVN